MHTTLYPTWLATVVLTLLGVSLSAQPCSSIASEIDTRSFIGFVPIDSGSAEAQLDVFALTGEPFTFPVSGQLGQSDDLSSSFSYRSNTGDGDRCQTVFTGAPYPVDVIRFVPSRDATVTFVRSGGQPNVDDISLTLFQDVFSPSQNNCTTFISSTLLTPDPVNTSNLEANLIGGRTYFLVVLTGRAPSGAYPRDYTIGVTSEDNRFPTFYTGEPSDPDYSYTYLAVDDTEELIRVESPTADFRTLGPGAYSIIGVNYLTSLGTDFFIESTLDEIRVQTNGDPECLQTSSNTLTFNVNAVVAPVDWLTFRAEVGKQTTQLYWDVASETDNDYFRIERSADGTDWTYLDDVAGNGTTQAYTAFTYTDATPLTGRSYYRLVQVDFDGSENPSVVVEAVRLLASEPISLITYPNPFSSSITVTAGVEAADLPRVYDVQGREVTRLDITRNGNEARITAPTLPTGVYLVRWADQQIRVVKQ